MTESYQQYWTQSSSGGSRRCKLYATLILRQRVCDCLRLCICCLSAAQLKPIDDDRATVAACEPRRLPACHSITPTNIRLYHWQDTSTCTAISFHFRKKLWCWQSLKNQ